VTVSSLLAVITGDVMISLTFMPGHLRAVDRRRRS
jgi:hypothetical protein